SQLVEKEGRFHNAAAHRIRLLMPQTRAIGHGTKEMVDMTYAPYYGLLHLLKCGMGMTGVTPDTVALTSPNKFRRAFHLLSHSGGDDAIGVGKVFLVLFMSWWA